MHVGLYYYLYAILLICISSSSFAIEVTDKDIAMGGFAYSVICAHPSSLNYCVNIEEQDAQKKACELWQLNLNQTYGYVFVSIIPGTPDRCLYEGKNPSNGLKASTTQALYRKNGLCPAKDQPPPEQIVFSRNGRWFPQELNSERCFRSCNYTNGKSFDYKHYVFTNGVITSFTESTTSRLKSVAEFCDPEPEPERNSEGEITYDASCEDNIFKVFCDFVEWFRSDSEMPEAPSVESEQLNLGYIKTDLVSTNLPQNTTCFEPIEFNLFLPWSRDEVKQVISFTSMCNGIDSFGNFLRVLYLLHAAFIVFGGRK